jgi:hypothetical protein
MIMQRTRQTMRACLALAAAIAAASLAGTAVAGALAAPVNSTAPTISGTPTVSQTLTADNGTWQNNPTAYQYRWLRCDRTGDGCGPIAGATQKTYTLVAADADKTIRVRVTAVNADGATDARSAQTQVVQSNTAAAPRATSRPSVSGDTTVGEELTADPGTWTNSPTNYAYQWRRCDTSPFQCIEVNGATGKTYGVREADIGFRMDVVVTASNAKGSGTSRSLLTAVVEPKARVVNHRPNMKIVSVRFAGPRVYARFRVCDDSLKNLTIIQTDTRPGRLSYTRRFSTLVAPKPCGIYTRNWMPAPRFRGSGKYTLVLRARDKSGLTSAMVRSTFVR